MPRRLARRRSSGADAGAPDAARSVGAAGIEGAALANAGGPGEHAELVTNRHCTPPVEPIIMEECNVLMLFRSPPPFSCSLLAVDKTAGRRRRDRAQVRARPVRDKAAPGKAALGKAARTWAAPLSEAVSRRAA